MSNLRHFASVLSILVLSAGFSSAHANLTLECATKKAPSDAQKKACERTATSRANALGCDVASVTCTAGGAGYTCPVESLYCESWKDIPQPEAPKAPDPKPSTKPSPTPSGKPSPTPSASPSPDGDFGDDGDFPTRGSSRSTGYDDLGLDPKTDPKTDPKSSTDPKTDPVTDPVTDASTSTNTNATPKASSNPGQVINPNRGCRVGYAKVATTKTSAIESAPAFYCRADSFTRAATVGACTFAWNRGTCERADCTECKSALGERRCELDAIALLASVNHGCESFKSEPKSDTELQVRCLKTSGAFPGERR